MLAWCADAGAAAIPYGGGTSVCGGIEPRIGDEYAGAVTIDLGALDRVLEVDRVSRAARVQAGVLGPALNSQLGEHGLTLRHFPQSFEYSTLGGWIATRAGGHFATVWTHIDDLVESVRALTPAGVWESRRLPGSGAGPSPDRMLIGSEGILGRDHRGLGPRPRAPDREALLRGRLRLLRGRSRGGRALGQSGLNPANCRLLDEASRRSPTPPTAGAPRSCWASSRPPCRSMGRWSWRWSWPATTAATPARSAESGERRAQGADAVGAWRHAFLAAPYLRDTFVAVGVLSETFETAITWDRFEDFHATVIETARRAVAEAVGAPAEGDASPRVMCRFTHVYPDGPAPYFTILAPARRGSEVEQWDEIKAAVSEALIDAGGTITHHHAVGRDHRPWYDRQRPEAVRGRPAGRQARARPGGDPQPRRADRPRWRFSVAWRLKAANRSRVSLTLRGHAAPDLSAASAGVGQEPARLRRVAVLGLARRGRSGARRRARLRRLLRRSRAPAICSTTCATASTIGAIRRSASERSPAAT